MKSSELECQMSRVIAADSPALLPPLLQGGAFQAPAARIAVRSGPDAGLSARIDRPRFIVGSGPTADLRLSDRAVSREHLQLMLVPDGIHLRDAGSTNGVWLNALRVNDAVVLRSTELLVGETTLSLSLERAPFELALVDGEGADADSETGERICHTPRCTRCSSETPGDAIERAAEGLAHLPYHEARAFVLEHFQRAYLPAILGRAGNVVIRAAKLAGVRRGSFHRMLRRMRGVREGSARNASAAASSPSSVSLDA